ncbi:hypothetical protein ACJ73_01324 [Blastomyces percursus]|uniref:Uncharacterized protein n=1 Tax=Blastomyces percursus TaxID=1658174 RepID=A0A1J9QGQ8_9EURO|nr:hypothetical protein ACJ73_01324 [Blastomyces percursus]
MINYHGTGKETIVEQVQVIDLENAAYLPKGRCIKGMLAGNDSWRNPEGHFKGKLGKPSDIFSFSAVKHESQGAFPHVIRLIIGWQTIVPTRHSQIGRMSMTTSSRVLSVG